MTSENDESPISTALNSIADWNELEKYDGGLSSNDMRLICRRAKSVFNELHESGKIVVKPDISTYENFVSTFSTNIFKIRVNTRYLLEACHSDEPISALKNVETRMQKQADYHEKYYCVSKTDAGDVLDGAALRMAARAFEASPEKVTAQNKATVVRDRQVRKGVLDNSGTKFRS